MIDIINSLNEEQVKPVLDTDGNVLVLAGAGSGKTRVLTSRIAHLIADKNVKPYNILSITFTNKASNEMKERIEQIVPCEGLWVSTIHSMCSRILRYDIDKLGFTNNFSIYTEDEKNRLLKRIIKEMNIDDSKLLKQVSSLISTSKNMNIEQSEFAKNYEYYDNIDEMAHIYEIYTEELKKSNSLDFDDLLTFTRKLLLENQEVREKYSHKFMYVHVDEFQDTNKIQFDIIKILASYHKNLFVVGDDDQSIYMWRGAEVRNILDFNKNFENVKVYKLQRNYRSTKNILEIANKLITNNIDRSNKTLYTENDRGDSVVYNSAYDEKAEAYYVTKKIHNFLGQGYNYRDFGILMRVNALTRNIEQEFLSNGIPYTIFGGFKFFERKEIKDALAYLRLLANPNDEDALLRIINVPKRGIGDTAISAIRNYAKSCGISTLEAVMNVDNSTLTNLSKNKIRVFANKMDILIDEMEKLNPYEFIKFMIKETGLYDMYSEKTDENISKKMNLDELIKSCYEFVKTNEGATIVDYLQSVTLTSELNTGVDQSNCVTITTVHAAKGLEFDAVFIIGLDENIFPLARAKESAKELEEERRLMYVAITRARKNLFLTRSERRFLYGKTDDMMKSRFLTEIGIVTEAPKRMQSTMSNTSYTPKTYASTQKSSALNSTFTKEQEDKCIVGGKISHKAFGEGVIVGKTGEGSSTMLEIAFKGVGIKTIVATIAPITFI